MKAMNSTRRSDLGLVQKTYRLMTERLAVARERLKRPLTYSEKIILSHLDDPETQELSRGESYLTLRPDRVAMHDVSGQMALLQFMLAGRDEAVVPTTLHCDHLIRAEQGQKSDEQTAKKTNAEVYEFLRAASSRYGIGFWRPGSGIIHQIILENYAFPGALLIGTDSHSANAGGLGTLASGVGGSDAADVMAGLPWEVKNPRLIGIHLKGELRGWAAPKDIILKICGLLSTKGGTDKVIEYFGAGANSLSCTGKATIANMGAELGATSSIFPYDERMKLYLENTGRAELAELADHYPDLLRADEEVLQNPEDYFDAVYEIDLTSLEPHVVGPHSPDKVRPLSQLAREARENGWPLQLSSALIGSCTNSSYEDIGRVAHIARQAQERGLSVAQELLISPGSTQIQKTGERDGFMKSLIDVGATVLANACGPCIGQWKRSDSLKGRKNSILTSFNRNFSGRNDGSSETLSFIASPEVVMALSLAGRLDFNPLTDTLDTPRGPLKFAAPSAMDLPIDGFAAHPWGFEAPSGDAAISLNSDSDRLQLLEPFAPWNGSDIENQLLLARIKGKCTTDHISPAGTWLRFRGHLKNISSNLLLGATNAFSGEIGRAVNCLSGEKADFASVARAYKAVGRGWVIVGDDNYGEGSSREHAAMSPRYLGCSAVIAKSFARIHETNLKKQGLLALTFSEPADYEKIREGDVISLLGLKDFAPGEPLTLKLVHQNGQCERLMLKHSYSAEHIEWFKAGSALNFIRSGKLK